MILEPFGWGVVVVGRWNPGILTPKGIGTLVFGLEEPMKLEVMVPLDGLAPYQVKSSEQPIVAWADTEKLKIIPLSMEPGLLEEAMKYGINALKNLPRTPVAAAGFNVKFRTDTPPQNLVEMLPAQIDTTLIGLGHEISARSLQRSLLFEGGILNFNITGGDLGYEVTFNFHRDATEQQDLMHWLQTPIEKIFNTVDSINEALGLTGKGG